MKTFRLWIYAVFVIVAFCGAFSAYAGNRTDSGNTDGKLGELLSTELYCGTKGLIEGNLGLVIGLLIVFGALWSLARGGKLMPALVSILFGASVTALPSLIESSMGGLGQLMQETGMSGKDVSYNPPKGECTNVNEQIKNTIEEVEKNRRLDGVCTGGYADCS